MQVQGVFEGQRVPKLGGFSDFFRKVPDCVPDPFGNFFAGQVLLLTRPRKRKRTDVRRKFKGAYSPRKRSRLETPFSEPLLRTLLRTLSYCKTHSRPPSQNPSENPFPRTLPRTLPRTFSEPFLEHCVAVRALRRAPNDGEHRPKFKTRQDPPKKGQSYADPPIPDFFQFPFFVAFRYHLSGN